MLLNLLIRLEKIFSILIQYSENFFEAYKQIEQTNHTISVLAQPLKATSKIILADKELSWKEVSDPSMKVAGKAHSLRKRVSQFEHFSSQGMKPAALKKWHRFAEKGRGMLGAIFRGAVGNKLVAREENISKINRFVQN